MLAVVQQLMDTFALPTGTEQMRDHGLICRCYGSLYLNQHVYIAIYQPQAPCMCTHVLEDPHPHFRWASLAGALLGGFSLGSTNRGITSMSPVMCPSEYSQYSQYCMYKHKANLQLEQLF